MDSLLFDGLVIGEVLSAQKSAGIRPLSKIVKKILGDGWASSGTGK